SGSPSDDDLVSVSHTLYNRGMVRVKLNKVADGIDDFTRVLEMDPQHAAAAYARASALNSQGDFARAIEDYTQALTLDDGSSLPAQSPFVSKMGRRASTPKGGRLRALSVPPSPSLTRSVSSVKRDRDGSRHQSERDKDRDGQRDHQTRTYTPHSRPARRRSVSAASSDEQLRDRLRREIDLMMKEKAQPGVYVGVLDSVCIHLY
ncbi:hypothetical protein KIPB_013279, partial [Kipferlia bialata]